MCSGRHAAVLGALPRGSRKAGLKFAGAFRLRKDYARTLREWLVRMQAAEPQITALAMTRIPAQLGILSRDCAATFEIGATDVVQVELVNA